MTRLNLNWRYFSSLKGPYLYLWSFVKRTPDNDFNLLLNYKLSIKSDKKKHHTWAVNNKWYCKCKYIVVTTLFQLQTFGRYSFIFIYLWGFVGCERYLFYWPCYFHPGSGVRNLVIEVIGGRKQWLTLLGYLLQKW